MNKTNCLYEDLLVPDISDTGIRDLVGKPLKSTLGTHLLGPLDAVARASSSMFVFSFQIFIICDNKLNNFYPIDSYFWKRPTFVNCSCCVWTDLAGLYIYSFYLASYSTFIITNQGHWKHSKCGEYLHKKKLERGT